MFGAGFADGGDEETLDAHTGVEDFLFGESGVDDVDNTVDGDTGLCDVGCDDDFASLLSFFIRFWRVFEDALLLVGREGAVEGYDCYWSYFIS